MRIRVNELLEPLTIKLSYFVKVLAECGIENRISLDHHDLKKLYDCVNVRTYKSQQLVDRVKEVLDSWGVSNV